MYPVYLLYRHLRHLTTQSPYYVHIASIDQQRPDLVVPLRAWLHRQGYALTCAQNAPLDIKLRSARACDVCFVVLGPHPSASEPLALFTYAELEVSAAADTRAGKLLIFVQSSISQQPIDPLQSEFVARLSDFAGGALRVTFNKPDELPRLARAALAQWRPTPPSELSRPIPDTPGAVMISSTSDLSRERDVIYRALHERHIPIIDYLRAAAEDITPIERVKNWAENCEALFVILDARYGYVSPVDGLGITELEFVTAYEANRPMFVFLGPHVAATNDSDQQQLIERVRALLASEGRIWMYRDSEDLKRQVGQAVLDWRRSAGQASIRTNSTTPVQAQRWYRRQVRRWLGRIPHLIRADGMDIQQIAVGVQIQDPQYQERNHARTGDPLDPQDALLRYPRLVLRGGPGAGKSLQLRRFAVDAPPDIIPIYLRLAIYARTRSAASPSPLLDAIKEEETRLCLVGAGQPSRWESALAAGQGLVPLDGLDEVPFEQVATVRGDIYLLAQALPDETRIVITSRPTEFTREFPAPFVLLDMQPLTDDQQRQLAEQWLLAAHQHDSDSPVEQEAARSDARVRAQHLMDLLDERPQLHEWARQPLYMTFLAALADEPINVMTLTLPQSQPQIYRRVIRLMLNSWAVRDQRRSGRHLWEKEQFARAVAAQRLDNRQGELFSEAQARAAWESLHFPATSTTALQTLLLELTFQDGLLQLAGEQLYGFFHPAFQEYFAATWLMMHDEQDAMSLFPTVTGRLDEPFMEQVVVQSAQIAAQQFPKLERSLYEGVLTQLGEDKVRSLQALSQGTKADTPLAASASGIVGALFDSWVPYLEDTLLREDATTLADREAASSIGALFMERPRFDAVPSLIRALHRYSKRARYIEALANISALPSDGIPQHEVWRAQAQDALLAFFTAQMAAPTDDPKVFDYILPALVTAQIGAAIPNLRAMADDARYLDGQRRLARHTIRALEGESDADFEERTLDDILARLAPTSRLGNETVPSDWREVKEAAEWIEHRTLSDHTISSHRSAIIALLRDAFGHAYDTVRIPVLKALAVVGDCSTAEWLLSDMQIQGSSLERLYTQIQAVGTILGRERCAVTLGLTAALARSRMLYPDSSKVRTAVNDLASLLAERGE